jgi:hypothetical protein
LTVIVRNVIQRLLHSPEITRSISSHDDLLGCPRLSHKKAQKAQKAQKNC